ncbi:MAG: c-type cytochrome [Dehalococcoidia bacterium]|nr:c-type cytochrome [Dehalococcoidia bacterium]
MKLSFQRASTRLQTKEPAVTGGTYDLTYRLRSSLDSWPAFMPRSCRMLVLASLLLMAMALLATGCRRLTGSFPGTGSYPADVFTEMHYQQSFRSQESPRLDSAGAVPVTGGELAYTTEGYATLTNPVTKTPQSLARGAELYRVNCSQCHGLQAKGDGKVGDALVANQYTRPPNLTAKMTADKPDGQIFGIVSEGLFVMPKFKLLLSSEDRWLIIQHVRQLQGR